jgi:hypothetical protein
MKNSVITSLALILVLGGTAIGQTEKRITFAKGKSSAVVKGSTGTSGVYYVVRARGGQKIVLDLSPAERVGVKVEGNGRYGHAVLLREESGGHFEVGLEESGDYTIFVGSLTGKPVAFSLSVSIQRMSDV